jgi:hypothetical protein
MRIDNYPEDFSSGTSVYATFDVDAGHLSSGIPDAALTVPPVPDPDPTMGYSILVDDISQEVTLVDPQGLKAGSFKQDGQQCPEMWDSLVCSDYPFERKNPTIEFFVSKKKGRAYLMYDMIDPSPYDSCNSAVVLSIIDLSTQVVTCELCPQGRPGNVFQRYSSEIELFDDLQVVMLNGAYEMVSCSFSYSLYAFYNETTVQVLVTTDDLSPRYLIPIP